MTSWPDGIAARLLAVLLLLSIISPFQNSSAGPGIFMAAPAGDPPGRYEGVGMPAPLFWTGDENKINNTSFETGTYLPWIRVQSNVASSTAGLVAPGYDGTTSVRLSIVSGNLTNNNIWEQGEPVFYDSNGNGVYDTGDLVLKGPTPNPGASTPHDPSHKYYDTNVDTIWTLGEPVIFDPESDYRYGINDIVITGNPPPVGSLLRDDAKFTFLDFSTDSYESLLYDLTGARVGFESSLRLRAAIRAESFTGTTSSDRAEVSATLATSLGGTLTIHYYISPTAENPSNSTTDIFYRISSNTGQWIMIDRNVPADASYSPQFSTLNSVRELRLSTLARTQPSPTDDSRVRYSDTNNSNFWDTGEPVVYDTNDNSQFDTGEQVISGTSPSPGAGLKDDPRIKFVDSDDDNQWDPSPAESMIYDRNSNGQWDFALIEPVIYGPTPSRGALLQKPVRQTSQSLFDKIELYSATGNFDWVRNGGFSNSLTGWRSQDFTTSSSIYSRAPPSALATVTNGAKELSQSIDAGPRIESWTRFNASVRIDTMTGSSRADRVSILLGMIDSQGFAISIYYMFRTGDLLLPNNTTDTLYLKVQGFGILNQWITISTGLQNGTQDLIARGHTPPFRLELVGLEVVASGLTSTTTAYFDDLSIYQPYKAGQALSSFYAVSGSNSTYVYTASNIPQGTFYMDIPVAQGVVNVTSPEGTLVPASQYIVQVDNAAGTRRITVPVATGFNHDPLGNWRVFTTSTNSVSVLYAEDPVKKTSNSTLKIGSTANLVSRSTDPAGRPIPSAAINITLWDDTTGSITLLRLGTSSAQGWFNVTSVTIPPGTYTLQATSLSAYAGVRTFQLSVKLVLTISLAISTSQIAAGRNLVISGKVAPPSPGITVTIYYRLAGSTQRTQLATVVTDSNGSYSYTWTPQEGDYEITAVIGDVSTASAESPSQVVFVGPPDSQFLLLALVGVAAVAAAAVLVALILIRKRKPQNQHVSGPRVL